MSEAIKGIRTATGGKMQYGQIIGGTPMSNNKIDQTAPFHPRNGAPKFSKIPEPVIGQRSRIAPSHQWAHGAPLDDEPLEKSFAGKGNVPTHPGMVSNPKGNTDDAFRGSHDRSLGNAVMTDASKLGK